MRNTLSTLALFAALSAQAQLPVHTDAPLYRHMLEVNAQWERMSPAPSAASDPVHFASDAARIATHLHLVAEQLRTRTPEGLSAAAMAHRSALLNDLVAYADRGLFPQNHVLPYRNPVFIDPYGTACAVGQLMIESGHRDLAEAIDREHELGYVAELLRSPTLGGAMAAWAIEHGFTTDELAWIQPGYLPSVSWSAMGGGTNGPVSVMLNLSDGAVLVAGTFTEAGALPVQNVAVYHGGAFQALGTGVPGTILCGTMHGDDIYLGGWGLGGSHDLAHWDGTQWSYSTVFSGKLPQIFALHVLNGTLYAAGEVQGFAGADEHVMQHTGSDWTVLAGNFNAPVRALGTHAGTLVAGGEFTAVSDDGTDVPAMHVAQWGAGGWAQLGDGLNGAVLALEQHAGSLYAGGAMYANASPVFGLARIAASASAWEPLMPNLGDYIPITPGTTQLRALLSDGGNLYVGGDFSTLMVMTMGNHLMRFLGAPDSFEPIAYFNGPVNALASNPFLIDAYGISAGGEFTLSGMDTVPYVAEAVLGMGVGDALRRPGMALYPNPASHRLDLRLDQPLAGPAVLELLDSQGRLVRTWPLTQATATVDVSTLAAGVYTLRVTGAAVQLAQPFIKR